jgi:hypothetical protein
MMPELATDQVRHATTALSIEKSPMAALRSPRVGAISPQPVTDDAEISPLAELETA